MRKTTDSLAENAEGGENKVRLARHPDVPSFGCPQALTPIRKLYKRSHLGKEEQAKRRKPLLDIPERAQDERDVCAVCLRMQQITGSTSNQICRIQCPTCVDWMHTKLLPTTEQSWAKEMHKV
ncbi:hypothetical protein RB195_008226 [Necator americanus]|uniref:Uncharacterized protein n=1 Tax=Necator americanus TaxID=51031 RepID=A0ABR1CMK2_NECAM